MEERLFSKASFSQKISELQQSDVMKIRYGFIVQYGGARYRTKLVSAVCFSMFNFKYYMPFWECLNLGGIILGSMP